MLKARRRHRQQEQRDRLPRTWRAACSRDTCAEATPGKSPGHLPRRGGRHLRIRGATARPPPLPEADQTPLPGGLGSGPPRHGARRPCRRRGIRCHTVFSLCLCRGGKVDTGSLGRMAMRELNRGERWRVCTGRYCCVPRGVGSYRLCLCHSTAAVEGKLAPRLPNSGSEELRPFLLCEGKSVGTAAMASGGRSYEIGRFHLICSRLAHSSAKTSTEISSK